MIIARRTLEPKIIRFYFERFDERSGNGKIVKKNDIVYYGEKIRLVAFILNTIIDVRIKFSLQLWKEKCTTSYLKKSKASFSSLIREEDMRIRNISNTPHIIELTPALHPTSFNQYYAISEWFTIPIDWYQLIEINEDHFLSESLDKEITANTHSLCLTANLESADLNIIHQELIQKSGSGFIETKDNLCLVLHPVYERNKDESTNLLNKFGVKETIQESIEYKNVFISNPQMRKEAESFTKTLYNIPYNGDGAFTLLKSLVIEYRSKLKYIDNNFFNTYLMVWLKRHPLFMNQYDQFGYPLMEFDPNKYNRYFNYIQESNIERLKKAYRQKLYLLELDITGNRGYDENIKYYTKKKQTLELKQNDNDLQICISQLERLTRLKSQRLEEIAHHKGEETIIQNNIDKCSNYIRDAQKNIFLYIDLLNLII